ncbi:MAG: dehydrogenase [Alphaproteobacteria bacterium RIFCSPHIGHO2_12_FULL_63_12]|nr:MAG: dehydrogenase [Alphaproteobacteria bacterium RIFCSPHIGHO2_12_FULL_63_12]
MVRTSDNPLDFTGKAVIVTGAASGIGAACARAFAAAGAGVIMADVNDAKNRDAADLIMIDHKANCIAHACNVASDADCDALVLRALDEFGRIDVLVNNAGIVSPGTILDLDPAEWDRVMDINLRSYFVLTQIAARAMIDRKIRGAIVNMSSLNAELAIANQIAYVASKGGVQQLTKAAALGLAPHGVRVNAIGPGSIMTDLLKSVMADDAGRRRILARTPLGRVGDPAEIASIALFLASGMASYITGQTIFADGGRAALNYTVPVDDR